MMIDQEPAFPVNFANDTEWPMDDPFGCTIPPNSASQYTGMTRRDYFAAKAMQAIIAKLPLTADASKDTEMRVSKGAFCYADAMIKESNDEG